MKQLDIAREDSHEIWIHCPWHKDENASLLVSKTGEFSGFFKCFSCGKFGTAKSLGLDITSKAYKKEHKHPNPIDWKRLSWEYEQRVINEFRYSIMQNKWGVSIKILKQLQLGWSGEAFTFPLRNENFEIIGIQRQFLDGSKKAINDSRLGLIIPQDVDFTGFVVCCEGTHDVATVLDLGFQTIGRPGANSVVSIAVKLLKGCKVLIIPDNDGVGIMGGDKLAAALKKTCVCNIMDVKKFGSCKDVSEFIEVKGKDYVRNYIKKEMHKVWENSTTNRIS